MRTSTQDGRKPVISGQPETAGAEDRTSNVQTKVIWYILQAVREPKIEIPASICSLHFILGLLKFEQELNNVRFRSCSADKIL